VGFFVIKDHPISSESIDKLFNFTQELFDLPLDVKMKYHLKGTNGARGYTPYGIETALNKNVPDQKEFWHQGSCSNPDLADNLTINELENFDDINSLYKEFEKLGIKILESISNFNIDFNADLKEIAVNGNSVLRLLHYPPVDAQKNDDRAHAHNDVNLITLLVGGNEGGLEALDKKGNWVECNCKKNEIICNVGDMLEIISNNKLRSTAHRVKTKNNEDKSRYSIPFFLHPRPEVILDLETNLTANDFLNKRLSDIKLG
jgi:isopenicillin N synthase-like dioxygenase